MASFGQHSEVFFTQHVPSIQANFEILSVRLLGFIVREENFTGKIMVLRVDKMQLNLIF